MNRLDALVLAAGLVLAPGAAAWSGVGAAAPGPAMPASRREVKPSASVAADPRGAPPRPAPLAERCPPLRVELPPVPTAGGDAPVPPIEYPEGARFDALASFYGKLARVVRGTAKAPVRMVVYGDSNGTRDYTTGHLRRALQLRTGDAGHGLVTLGRPWRWHSYLDVGFDDRTTSWGSFTVTSNLSYDGYYGHALITAYGLQTGARTWVSTADARSPVGRSASRFEVAYLKGPRMGAFDVLVDGKVLDTVDAKHPSHEAGFSEVRVPDGPHKLEIVTKDTRHVRILNVVVEREVPGVVVDNVGVGMLNCPTVLRDDPAVHAQTLARRGYDLVVYHLGTLSQPKDYAPCMDKLVARHRAALPGVPILVLSPPDFLNDDSTPWRPAPWVPKVRDAERSYARSHGLAFFDFLEAMGGPGSMIRFERLHFTVHDGVHLSEKGGEYMGARVAHALLRDFDAWAEAHPSAGCEE